MNVNRRIFLKQGALAFVCHGRGPVLGPALSAPDRLSPPISVLHARNKILICIFQRGAVDGLSMVVPYGDPYYYQNRPDISLAAPSQAAGDNGALDLDGYFGLQPGAGAAAAALSGRAISRAIQACGSPNASRSHFDSQDLMESGVDEDQRRAGRLAQPPARLLSRGRREEDRLPRRVDDRRSFRAACRASRIPSPSAISTPSAWPATRAGLLAGPSGTANGFESMYGAAVDTVLHGTAQRIVRRARSSQENAHGHLSARPTARPIRRAAFGRNLKQIAQLIKANVGRAGRLRRSRRLGHPRQPGQRARASCRTRLGGFAEALAALHQDLGDRMADVVVVTMSEFGRAVHQNGNRGTDHGHGTCFFAMGGPIKGGKVYGDWPTLAPDKLFQNRDLAITTDFRDVFGEICAQHFSLPVAEMAPLFPHYQVDAQRFRRFCVG